MDVLFRARQRTLASSFEQGVGQGLFARLHPLDGSLDGIFGDQAMHEYRLVLADPVRCQHYRIAGINLLAAIIIYWNTLKLGEAVLARNKAGLVMPVEFLTHVSPLGWERINLTGEYRWPGTRP